MQLKAYRKQVPAQRGVDPHADSLLDGTNADEWQAAIDAAEKPFGKINALFNNAGILSQGSVAGCTPEEVCREIDVNLKGVFLEIKAVASALRRAGGGVIVNTSSTAGLQGYGGLAAHVASTWGIRGLTKAAALNLASDRIRVTSLHPGPIRTPMTAGMSDEVIANQPTLRFGEPEEVCESNLQVPVPATQPVFPSI